MNTLSQEKKNRIASMLVEGVGMRAICRMVNVSTPTVCKFMKDFGAACLTYSDQNIRGLNVSAAQCDEMWTFVQQKQNQAWIWTAMCPQSKLFITWRIGNRSLHTGQAFMSDVRARINGRVKVTTDAHNVYGEAIDQLAGIDHQVALAGGYKRRRGNGSTYAVERHNLTLRTSIGRLSRGANGFSKSVFALNAHLAVWCVYYNYVRAHLTLRVTPAMEAGLADHVWTMDEFLSLHPIHTANGAIVVRKDGLFPEEVLAQRMDILVKLKKSSRANRERRRADHIGDSVLKISHGWSPALRAV